MVVVYLYKQDTESFWFNICTQNGATAILENEVTQGKAQPKGTVLQNME
jgi:hypothetical protein